MKKFAFLLVIIIFGIQCSTLNVLAQQTRPKVAVVMSGGGAKGMAHIGALRVIEKAGIPIDIITGTSMGSIIGGLYSIGYDSERLDSMVHGQDWIFLLTDKADPKKQNLADREKQNTYILSKELNLKRKSLASSGLIEGKNLAVLFNKLCAGYRDSLDFNKLPIPFACVATDIVDNTEYDFHSGHLAQAMRSSMSIPGAFTPVRLGDKVLVDGGLRNNFPADIARQMGADYVIGITLQGPPKTADDLSNGASVIGQIVDVNCKNKYDANLAITDIPIRVNTQGYSAASFTPVAIDTLIARGESEAMKHWDELIALKKKLGVPDDYKPERLALYNGPDTLQTEISKPSDDSGALKVNFGARFDTEEMAAIQVNGSLNTLPLKNDRLGGEVTLRLGKRIMARGDVFYKHKDGMKMTFSYIFRHNDINIYDEGDKEYNITYNQHTINLSLLDFNLRNFNFKIGPRFDFYHFDELLASNAYNVYGEDLESQHFISYHADVNYNSENSGYLPTRGAKFQAGYAYYSDNFALYNNHVGFSVVNASWRMSFGVNKRLTFQPMAYGRLLFGRDVPVIQSNFIGGNWFGHYMEQQLPLAGLGNMENVENSLIGLQLCLQERFTENNYILLKVAGAQHSDYIGEILDEGPYMGYQASYYYDTKLIGPVGASFGYSSKSRNLYFYINLGYEF